MRTVLSASSLEGNDVKNAEGEKLGDIKEIMLDTSDGRIAYYVLSFGGFMGLGDKLFAVPPEAMRLDQEEECFILNVDQDRLEDAPGFDKDNWPDMTNPEFTTRIYTHYGYEYGGATPHHH